VCAFVCWRSAKDREFFFLLVLSRRDVGKEGRMFGVGGVVLVWCGTCAPITGEV
jgi:hypothetical protein